MFGHSPLSAAPISALGKGPIPPPELTPVRKFRRFLREKLPPSSRLLGGTTRRGGVPADIFQQAPIYIPTLRRFLKSKSPPPGRIPGHFLRRGGVSEDLFFRPILFNIRRLLKSKFPPIDEIRGRHSRSPARPPPWFEFSQVYEQGFRVADLSFDLFELFIGEDAAVDFSASGQPVATSPTLPFAFTPTPPPSGSTKTLHVVVRKRNKYDLQSFNVFERFVVIDSSGAELLGPVSVPFDVQVYDDVSGSARVVSKYFSTDDNNPADTWEVYAEEGVDPIPGTDTPAFTGTMLFLGDESMVSEVVGGFTPGAVLHVIVCAVRAADTERGCAEVVLHTLAVSLDLTDGSLFGGTVYEQR